MGNPSLTGGSASGGGLLPLLKDLFVHHGHMVTDGAQLEGKSGTVYEIPLLAESETGAVVIASHDGPSPLTAAEVEEFAATVADVAADHGVLAHTGPSEPDAIEAAQGIVLWSRDTLARYFGDVQVAEAIGEKASALSFETVAEPEFMVAEQVADVLPESFLAAEVSIPSAEPAPEPIPEPVPDFSAFAETFNAPPSEPVAPSPPPAPAAISTAPPVPRVAVPNSPFGMLLAASAAPATSAALAGYAPAAAAPTPFNPWGAPASTTASAPAPMPAPAPTRPEPPVRTYSRPLLPAKLRPDDAHKKVRDRLYSLSNVELVLHPVHLFNYEVDLLQEGKLTFDTVDGRVQVHGSDKSTLEVDPDQANPDATSALAPNHTYGVMERVLRIQEDRAIQLAVAHVTKTHSKVVDVRIPDANNSLFYTERRKVEPKGEQIRLFSLGVYFRPAWRLHGDNGYVEVDALDGRELDVALVGSRHGAMILE